ELKKEAEQWKKIYKDYLKGNPIEEIKKLYPTAGKVFEEKLNNIMHGDLYVRDAYVDLKARFDDAYEAAKNNANSKNEEEKKKAKEDLEKLDNFKKIIAPKVKSLEKDPTQIEELADAVIEGIHVLKSINPPERLKPLREFAIDKTSETFANVAFKAFDKFGNTAPIISIENPPAGSALSRAEDLRDVINDARFKLSLKLQKEKDLSESEAKKQAEKLIGATWDIGHINMLRKFGYQDKDLIKQTETINKFINKVHLSDNFGMVIYGIVSGL
ncbi:MAG: hypothetical protein MUD09_02020, partial [Desulfobacterales bacterium]|nr:hypothetical protein [Desulfobacterales bacterium]